MTYKEYPNQDKTYIVHHTTGTGEQGGSPIQEEEIVFASENYEEADSKGQELYPRVTGWEWDNYSININTCTAKGKVLLEQFKERIRQLEEHVKAHPEDYTTYNFRDGTAITLQHNPNFDEPKET